MQPGVIPYSVNSPLWSDGAHKERYFAIPEHAAADYKIDLAKKNGWDFPDETVLHRRDSNRRALDLGQVRRDRTTRRAPPRQSTSGSAL